MSTFIKRNEALFNATANLTAQDIEALNMLPILRDEIFSDYDEQLGYLSVEPSFEEVDEEKKAYKINIPLTSFKANRTLMIAYVFKADENPLKAVITDFIKGLDIEPVWNAWIDMDILMQKRGAIKDSLDYRRLENYSGSLAERLKACLEQIKFNYDTYALDIISGEHWDNTAHDHIYD